MQKTSVGGAKASIDSVEGKNHPVLRTNQRSILIPVGEVTIHQSNSILPLDVNHSGNVLLPVVSCDKKSWHVAYVLTASNKNIIHMGY